MKITAMPCASESVNSVWKTACCTPAGCLPATGHAMACFSARALGVGGMVVLYRPSLDRGLPVNLAGIPKVRTDTMRVDGRPEGYLFAKNGEARLTIPIGESAKLASYLLDNPGYHVAQHGYDHSLFEFDSKSTADIDHRLEQGTRLLLEAGFQKPPTFCAPYDR